MTLYHCLKPAHIYAQPCDDCPDPSLCELRADASPDLVGTTCGPPLVPQSELEFTGRVVSLPILPCFNPWVKWYRHPIYWWKWRHFRKDVKVMEAAVDPDFKRMVDEALDNAFLNGTGGEK